jgi:uncharacterized protein involved in exopolysaccharide biosynthesis
MDTVNPNHSIPEELSLREFLGILKRVRWAIISIVVIAALIAGIAASLLPKTYRATVLMAVVTSNSGSGPAGALGSLVSQMGGLGSLAGISTGADSKKAESVAVLQSEVLTERYIADNRLLPVLYASKWDNVSNRWKELDTTKVPTLWKANEYFKKNIRTVTTDPKSGLVTLTINWSNSAVATKWANDLVKLANDYLRKKAIDESERNIAYLNGQATQTDVVGVKQAIYTLMETEINKAMMARGSDEYAFKILDPAVAPENPFSPRPLLWVIVALFGSSLLSISAMFAWAVWTKN